MGPRCSRAGHLYSPKLPGCQALTQVSTLLHRQLYNPSLPGGQAMTQMSTLSPTQAPHVSSTPPPPSGGLIQESVRFYFTSDLANTVEWRWEIQHCASRCSPEQKCSSSHFMLSLSSRGVFSSRNFGKEKIIIFSCVAQVSVKICSSSNSSNVGQVFVRSSSSSRGIPPEDLRVSSCSKITADGPPGQPPVLSLSNFPSHLDHGLIPSTCPSVLLSACVPWDSDSEDQCLGLNRASVTKPTLWTEATLLESNQSNLHPRIFTSTARISTRHDAVLEPRTTRTFFNTNGSRPNSGFVHLPSPSPIVNLHPAALPSGHRLNSGFVHLPSPSPIVNLHPAALPSGHQLNSGFVHLPSPSPIVNLHPAALPSGHRLNSGFVHLPSPSPIVNLHPAALPSGHRLNSGFVHLPSPSPIVNLHPAALPSGHRLNSGFGEKNRSTNGSRPNSGFVHLPSPSPIVNLHPAALPSGHRLNSGFVHLPSPSPIVNLHPAALPSGHRLNSGFVHLPSPSPIVNLHPAALPSGHRLNSGFVHLPSPSPIVNLHPAALPSGHRLNSGFVHLPSPSPIVNLHPAALPSGHRLNSGFGEKNRSTNGSQLTLLPVDDLDTSLPILAPVLAKSDISATESLLELEPHDRCSPHLHRRQQPATTWLCSSHFLRRQQLVTTWLCSSRLLQAHRDMSPVSHRHCLHRVPGLSPPLLI